jgi:uncharacterized membrane protein
MRANSKDGERAENALVRLAEGLGWFSLALGVAEVVAPRRFGRFIGVDPRAGLIRGLGLQKIASGLGILTQRRTSAWVGSRVAGDALDLMLLVGCLFFRARRRPRIVAATAAVAGVTALDAMCARRLSQNPQGGELGWIDLAKTLTVDRPAEQLYQAWRDFEKLPRFMNHLESVRVIDEKRSHWVAKGPAGSKVEWDAEISEEIPNERIAWRSVAGQKVEHNGGVAFEPAPGGRGTVVRVELHYRPAGGALGVQIARLFGEAPGKQIAVDLRRFKQLMETGEIARTEGQAAGRAHSTSRKYDDFIRA